MDARIEELSDWRGRDARSGPKSHPEVIEEWKWRGFRCCRTRIDPSGLFNAFLEAIDFHEGDKIDEKALKVLIRAAVALNTSVRTAAGPVRSQRRPRALEEIESKP